MEFLAVTVSIPLGPIRITETFNVIPAVYDDLRAASAKNPDRFTIIHVMPVKFHDYNDVVDTIDNIREAV